MTRAVHVTVHRPPSAVRRPLSAVRRPPLTVPWVNDIRRLACNTLTIGSDDRHRIMPTQQGFTLWFTGLSGAGKTTISSRVAPLLEDMGLKVEVLDGDVIRENLSTRLGFSRKDRDENIKRIGWICELLTRNGVATLAAAISPYRQARAAVRERVSPFIEVFCDCPLDVLTQRDPKGLYERALAGEIKNFTGVDDPYERPTHPDVHLDTAGTSIDFCVQQVLDALEQRGLVPSEEG